MDKYYYTIGEVSNLLAVKPHVIRYWETEFTFLRPKKKGGRIRKFSESHIEMLKKIKNLLYTQKFTIEGARQKLKQERDLIHTIAEDAKPEQLSLDLGLSSEQTNCASILAEVRSELCKLKKLCNQYNRK
ncbi:MAG: MerR family transcriptional regulator [Candidatus Cloacimonas sp.]|jgi:DNA-binding transcriptional MerR regulator|nr:MerR family transcriptional regulator [Candidatus Cloacimonas sp.]